MAKFKLIDIMPSSISGDKKVQAICEVLDPYLEVLWEQIDNISIYKNIDKLDGEKLDHLAYQFHVDYYNTDWSAEKKRLAIKNSIAWHRYKGTPWAVEHLLSTLFTHTGVSEWFEYSGDPYYFRIHIQDTTDKLVIDEDFFEALWTIKNTRSWLDKIIVISGIDLVAETQAGDYTYPQFLCGLHDTGTIPRIRWEGQAAVIDMTMETAIDDAKNYKPLSGEKHVSTQIYTDRVVETINMTSFKSSNTYSFERGE